MKIGKVANTYALATQGIFSMIIFAVGGYCLGYFLIDSVLWGIILAIVGLILGLFMFVGNLMYILKKAEEEQAKEKKQNAENEQAEESGATESDSEGTDSEEPEGE
ncbi:MAG: hypothetical protein K6A63_03440 [Acholeplasmatales bacterium]|nr:hypothetical protein [Acholeplasmatales bacterium]